MTSNNKTLHENRLEQFATICCNMSDLEQLHLSNDMISQNMDKILAQSGTIEPNQPTMDPLSMLIFELKKLVNSSSSSSLGQSDIAKNLDQNSISNIKSNQPNEDSMKYLISGKFSTKPTWYDCFCVT